MRLLRLSSLHLREVGCMSLELAGFPLDRDLAELFHGRPVDATGGTRGELLALQLEPVAERVADERTAIEYRRIVAALRRYETPASGTGWALYDPADEAGRWAR